MYIKDCITDGTWGKTVICLMGIAYLAQDLSERPVAMEQLLIPSSAWYGQGEQVDEEEEEEEEEEEGGVIDMSLEIRPK